MNSYEFFSIIHDYLDLIVTCFLLFISFVTFLDKRYRNRDN